MEIGKTYKSVVCLCTAAASVVGLHAEETIVPISHAVGRVSYTTDTVLVPQTDAADALPDVGVEPIFWFDCSETSGWTIDAATREVTVIPSKTGNGRTLATAFADAGNWTGWSDGMRPPTGPVLLESLPDLQGGAALDFGAQGSGRGLVFSPVGGVNDLQGIGTVVAVYDSSASGGWILGGGTCNEPWKSGWNPDETIDPKGYYYRRGSQVTTAEDELWRKPILDVASNAKFSFAAPPSAINGVIWQNGVPTTPHFAGFSGGWELVSFMPKDSDGYGFALSATGIGLGDTRPDGLATSGGMRIAEMIFYGRNLTDAEREKVEAYLAKKWFGVHHPGFGGHARVGDIRLSSGSWPKGLNLTAVVPADETLAVERLRGGHGRAASAADGSASTAADPKLTKRGAGTLEIGDGTENGLDIELEAGTLAFARRAIPAALPPKPFLHLDASALPADAYETKDGVRYVTEWTPAEGLAWDGNAVTLSAAAVADVTARPVYVPDALGPGRGAIDFGKAGSGRHFLYVKASDKSSLAVKGVTTVIAVVNVEAGGGTITGGLGFFDRGATPATWSAPVLSDSAPHPAAHPTITPRMGKAYIDGIETPGADNYRYPGWHLVAFQTAGSQLTHFGGRDAATAGGLKVAEAVLYDRVLTERELKDACAVLNAKWFGRAIPGYAGPGGAAADESRKVTLTGDATLSVEGVGAAHVPALALDGRTLTKTGAGTLEVDAVTADAGGTLALAEGTFAVAADGIASDCQMASGAAFHLDATADETLSGFTENGYRYVSCWHDTGFRNAAWSTRTSANLPWVTTAEEDLEGLTGEKLAAVDFGSAEADQRWLNFGRSLDSVRAAFVVWHPNTTRSSLLGSSSASGEASNGDCISFQRSSDGALFNGHFGTWSARNGTVFRDGEKITGAASIASAWQLIEVYPVSTAHASALGCDRGDETSFGNKEERGSRYAEVILYTRELTERERVATRNYLRRKWFGAAAAPLPDAAGEVRLPTLAVASGTAVQAGRPLAVAKLVGEADFAKRGDARLTVTACTAYTGTVSVAAGELRLTGDAAVAPPPCADALVLRLDANVGVETTTDDDGVETVTRWNDATGNGWAAVPGTYGVKGQPVLQGCARLGRSAVYLSAENQVYMSFVNSDGTNATVAGVRSAFWVMDTSEGGGWLLAGGKGTGTTQNLNFHRGGDGTATNVANALLLGYHSQTSLRNASWYVNGTAVAATAERTLTGGWDLIEMNMADANAEATSAEGLASDGRSLHGGGNYERSGAQTIGEVLLYNRALTEDERLAVEAYLRAKWHVPTTPDASGISVALAPGGRLDLGNRRRPLESLTGSGTVTNGCVSVAALCPTGTLTVAGDVCLMDGGTWTVRFDGAASSRLAVDGCLSVGSALTVAVEGLDNPMPLYGQDIPLADFGSVSGATKANLRAVTVTGLPKGWPARVFVRGQTVYLRLGRRGACIIIR